MRLTSEITDPTWEDIRDRDAEIERLRTTIAQIEPWIPHFMDGPPILHEGPCWTPAGRCAYVKPFSSTPIAVIKGERPEDDETFMAEECYSTKQAASAAGGE